MKTVFSCDYIASILEQQPRASSWVSRPVRQPQYGSSNLIFRVPVSSGGLTLAWKNLAARLEGQYEAIGQKIRHSAVLHADETGWRINGVTFWLWAFATRQYCYYLIDRRRGAAVVKQVLGTLFPGILITDPSPFDTSGAQDRLLGRLQRHRNTGQTTLLLPPVHRTGQGR